MSKTHLTLIAIVGFGLLIGGIDYTLDLRDKLTLANQQVKGLKTTIEMQSAFSSAMNSVSEIAIQTKQDSDYEKQKTQHYVREVIKTDDCANVFIPTDAVERLRGYANSMRGTAY